MSNTPGAGSLSGNQHIHIQGKQWGETNLNIGESLEGAGDISKAISKGSQKTWAEFAKANPNIPKETLAKSYAELIDGQSPWPEGYIPKDSTLKSGDTFKMVLDAEQPVGRPGGFATMDEVPNIDYARNSMAIKVDWKIRYNKFRK